MTTTTLPRQRRHPMVAALICQIRVVGALVLRETRARFGRTQFGYLWAIIEPVTYVIVFGFLFTMLGRNAPYGNDVALFFTTAILPFLLAKKLSTSLSNAFESNGALLTYPIVKPIDTLIARAVLEIATTAIASVFIYAFLVMVRGSPLPARIDIMLQALLGMILVGYGVGTINAVLSELSPSWRKTYDLLSRPLFLVSGIFYTIDAIPEPARTILSYNPLIHGVELSRVGYFGNYRCQTLDVPYLFWFGLISCLIGLALERAIRIRSQ